MQSKRRLLLTGATAAVVLAAVGRWRPLVSAALAGGGDAGSNDAPAGHFAVTHTDAQWRQILTPQEFDILRREGTEMPYSSPLNSEHRAGVFSCAGCQLKLYESRTKYDSHTGWPSFWAPIDHAISTRDDHSFGVLRTEVHCQQCGGHLGHVFNDGPQPTGLRYCMNGLAMKFTPA